MKEQWGSSSLRRPRSLPKEGHLTPPKCPQAHPSSLLTTPPQFLHRQHRQGQHDHAILATRVGPRCRQLCLHLVSANRTEGSSPLSVSTTILLPSSPKPPSLRSTPLSTSHTSISTLLLVTLTLTLYYAGLHKSKGSLSGALMHTSGSGSSGESDQDALPGHSHEDDDNQLVPPVSTTATRGVLIW